MQSMTLPIGTELGGYVLAGVLGSGASGTVYRARDAEGLPVALKLLHPNSAADPASRKRLRREVAAQRAIRSPFVAQVVDAELDGAEAFIVTELVEGVSLARDIAVEGPWGPEQLACLARDLDWALSAVHAAGVLHRDVKPSNVVLNKTGRPVLIDFGIAQDSGAGRLTAAGLVAGTPGFVSPELLRGADPSVESDRWAAAALLLNAATGRQPFGAGTVESVLARVLDGLPDVDGLPRGMTAAFRRALTPDPDRRIGLAELAEAIFPTPEQSGSDTEESLAPTRIAPVAGADRSGDWTEPGIGPGAGQEIDPREAGWTEPLRTPWREPRRVDYRTWLSDTRDLAGGGAAASDQSAAHEGGLPAPAHPPAGALPSADAVPPRQPYPSPPAPLRLLTLGLWALLGAVAWHWPWVAVVIAGCGLVVARTVWVVAESVAARRYRRGPRPSDRTRTVLASPWYFLRGLGGSIPALALAGLVGAAGYLIAVHVVAVDGAKPLAVAICVAVGLMVAWWGPSAAETRQGLRVMLRGLLWSAPVRWLVTLLVFAAAVWAAAMASWPT
ncbi:MAG: serine/threonine protein kinase [Bifidobacteriaceae bacterium]|jgi:serine/threonine protein kinase|nr:serine/threonine protein kinase [Bifidobacteriaceae bacterium]